MVVLAELEIYHSRPIAPTRRVALGERLLPVDPAPGVGGVLLAGIVARFAPELEADLYAELQVLIRQLEHGARIPQPRLRHRFQADRVGLSHSHHRLIGEGDRPRFHFEADRAAPAQQVLGAVYAAGELPPFARVQVMETIRRGLRWRGVVGPSFVTHVLGRTSGNDWGLATVTDPVAWARDLLGIAPSEDLARAVVQRRFRELLRDAHPDVGGDRTAAARRIAELTEARRILLAS